MISAGGLFSFLLSLRGGGKTGADMKIIIAGDGKIGETLTRQLSAEGHDLTLIDSDPEVLKSTVDRYDVLSVNGNCASLQTLRDAEVEKADLLITAANEDEVNLLSCLTAHGLNPRLHTIARIRNPEYLEQVYSMQELFALSLSINPEQQAAREIEQLIQYPGFLRRETFANGRVEIVELRVEEGSRLCSVALSSLSSVVHCQVLVCAVLRDGSAAAPDGSFVLRAGDRIFVTADTGNLTLLLKNLGITTHRAGRVMIAGGGRISYYLASRLLASGIEVRLIEQDPRTAQRLALQLPKACVVEGDVSIQELLESEGLTHMDAFVSLTGIDELNMIISLYAASRRVPQVITKLGRPENLRMTDRLHLGSVVCPRELCASTIVRYVRAMQNQVGAAKSMHYIADGQAEAMEFRADETTQHCGEPLKKIQLRPNVLIACITHGAETVIPDGDSHFEAGDIIIVVTNANTVIGQLNQIFA